MLTPEEFMNLEIGGDNFAAYQAASTTKKSYRDAYIYINITSHSQRAEKLHKCARLFQISKIPGAEEGQELTNVDFAFGHSVGAGVQTYLITGSKDQAIFAGLLAWNIDLDSEVPKKGKSSVYATLAIEKFIHFWNESFGVEWEIAIFNGKPSAELTFFLDTENGYYHVGHIDAILRHRATGRYMVLELKTTSILHPDEALYGNSEQPLGYSLILDKIAEVLDATASFSVLYLAYSSTGREWIPFFFTKNRSERIDWLQDLLLDHTTINTYRQLKFFPKRGNACWSFSRRCVYYGVCDLRSYTRTVDFKEFDVKTMELPEPVDFHFTLKEITQALLR